MSNVFNQNDTVGQTLVSISNSETSKYFGFGVILDDNKSLIGVTTIKELALKILEDPLVTNEKIQYHCSKNYVSVTQKNDGKYDIDKAIKIISQKNTKSGKVRFVPIVTKNGTYINIKPYDEIFSAIQTYSVSIYGLGFVGLTLMAAVTARGFNCIGIDKSNTKISDLRNNKLPVLEDGLEELYLNLNLSEKIYGADENKPVSNTKIICVGTDINANFDVNYSPLKNVVDKIGSELKIGDLVILRSTVPVGCTRNIVIDGLQKNSGLIAGTDFFVSFCPERTVEGQAINEIFKLPQIIGGFSQACVDKAAKFFSEIAINNVLTDSLEAAEFIKLLNNSFRDLTFAFSNEIIFLADKFNLDATKLVKQANYNYPRNTIALPSPGVGGYCLTKDPYIYTKTQETKKMSLSMMGRKINDRAQKYPLVKFKEHIKKYNLDAKILKIGVLGIAFKGIPETNDVRGSTGLNLAISLMEEFGNIFVHDPCVNFKTINKELTETSSDFIFQNCHAVFIMNNNPRLIGGEWELLNNKEKDFFLFDGWLNLSEKVPKKYLEKITFCTLGKVM